MLPLLKFFPELLRPMFSRNYFFYLLSTWVVAFAASCAFAQQASEPQQKSAPLSSSATPSSAVATSAPGAASGATSGNETGTTDAAPSPTPAQPAPAQNAPPANMNSAAETPIPGLDPKTMLPLYETIQEDWSSLQIGVSKLEPLPPIVGEFVEQDKFTRVTVRVQWRPGDPIDLWILLPAGVKKPPVVLYLYGPGTGNENRFRDPHWSDRVTQGGVAAVGFEMALTGGRFRYRPMKQTMLTELQEAIGSTVHDVKFILDYLDKSGQFDMNRVGMFGDAVGGTVAILAAAADPRIKAVDTLEPWGDWPDFLAKSPVIADADRANFVKPEFLKKVAPLDPMKWLPELKIPVRIQQIKETPIVPLECKEAISAGAPKQAEVMRYAAVTDITKRESGGRLFDWVKNKLQEPQQSLAGANAKVAAAQQAPAGDKSGAKN
jgi:hypothetical protein